MKFRFENLQVWQDARRFISQIYSITKNFPSEERFALVDQLRRAAVSIALNIAEGSDRNTNFAVLMKLLPCHSRESGNLYR